MNNTTNTVFALALLSLSAFAAGCSGSGDDSSEENEREAEQQTPASSQPSGSSSSSNAFLGTWALGGTQSTTCGAASGTSQLNGVVIITGSSSAGAIETKYSSTCSMTWDVSGNAATVEKAQLCTVAVGDENVTVTLTSGTMTMTGDKTATVLLSGAAANGCSFTQQETLTME